MVRFILSKRYEKRNVKVREDLFGCVIAIVKVQRSENCFCKTSRLAGGCDICVQSRNDNYERALEIVYKHLDENNATFKQYMPDNPFECEDLFLLLITF